MLRNPPIVRDPETLDERLPSNNFNDTLAVLHSVPVRGLAEDDLKRSVGGQKLNDFEQVVGAAVDRGMVPGNANGNSTDRVADILPLKSRPFWRICFSCLGWS